MCTTGKTTIKASRQTCFTQFYILNHCDSAMPLEVLPGILRVPLEALVRFLEIPEGVLRVPLETLAGILEVLAKILEV